MRLIDADKLHYIRKWFEDSGKSEVVVFAKEIDKAPTVNAIPIEWLINKCNEADNMGMGIDDWSVKDCYQLVLEQWEKENETN